MLTLTLANELLPVTVTYRLRKTIGIRVRASGVEVVAHPRVSQRTLEQLLDARLAWIARHWQRARERRDFLMRYPKVVLIGGDALEIVTFSGTQLMAELGEGCVRVSESLTNDGGALKQAIAQLLQREAMGRFTARFTAMLPLILPRKASLVISSARTRWGSCTAQGVIRLNWRLVQAPLPVLDYVLAHELAHRLHMNHSVHFWRETARLFPAWRWSRQWLQQHGHTLHMFG